MRSSGSRYDFLERDRTELATENPSQTEDDRVDFKRVMPENRSRFPKRQSDDAAGENSLRPEGGAGAGVKSWKHTVWLWAPILIAVLVFLFDTGVVSRFGQSEAPSDGRNNGEYLEPAKRQQPFHATYSFRKAPFVHPKIVNDLIGYLSDVGDQVVAINLLDSQDSNRYFGEIFVTPQTDPLVPSWPWVYSLDGEPTRDGELGDFWGQIFYAYRYLGSTGSGLDVLHAKYSGGGAGVSNYVMFVRTEADYGVEYPLPRDIDSRQNSAEPEIHDRELIRILGRIPLGDRWIGTVEVAGDDVVVRGRDLYERCEMGGTSTMERVEMNYFMDTDCKESGPDHPPPAARVYNAPVQR